MRRKHPPLPRTFIGVLLLCAAASANDRHFGYTYETRTLPQGARELELWTTARVGRVHFYSQLDHRMEFETGLTDRLQTSFYLNWSQTTADTGGGSLATEFSWQGFSSEWKYKFSDPSADPLGFALYGEAGYNTDAVELEGKALFDKQAGPLLLAANLVSSSGLKTRTGKLEEQEFEVDLAGGYSPFPSLSLGLELRNHSRFLKDANDAMKFQYSALFLGPTVAYLAKAWWLTITAMPQLPGFKTTGGARELNDHEALETRILFSLHL
jgi:hypothetical protein